MTTFEDRIAAREPRRYADFLLPHLDSSTHLLDIGCGDGALTIGLAAAAGRVTGVDVEPHACVGTPDLVRAFAQGRADESADDEWVAAAAEAGLATEDEMATLADAWRAWGESPVAYAAFTWCRAVGSRSLADEEGHR